VPQLDSTDVQWHAQAFPDLSVAQLTRGRELYVQSCSGCHALYPPSSRTPAGWHEALRTMAPKVQLDGADREAVLRYLLVASQRPRP
jgi:hypothetical protein